MVLMLLYQARAANTFHLKITALFAKLIFFPCKFRAHMVGWGKNRLPEWPFPGGIGNGPSQYSAKPSKWEVWKANSPSVPVPGSQRVTFSSTGEEKIASSLLLPTPGSKAVWLHFLIFSGIL